MSLMYRRNRSGPRTVPWGTPDVTICVSEWEPFTSRGRGGMTAYRGMFAHPSTDREA